MRPSVIYYAHESFYTIYIEIIYLSTRRKKELGWKVSDPGIGRESLRIYN